MDMEWNGGGVMLRHAWEHARHNSASGPSMFMCMCWPSRLIPACVQYPPSVRRLLSSVQACIGSSSCLALKRLPVCRRAAAAVAGPPDCNATVLAVQWMWARRKMQMSGWQQLTASARGLGPGSVGHITYDVPNGTGALGWGVQPMRAVGALEWLRTCCRSWGALRCFRTTTSTA
jgi:hypothetical protein